ncbi:phage tail tape measure protein [Xanthobacter sediminis]
MAQKLTSELALKLTQQVSGPAAEARKALSTVDQALAAIAARREADQRLMSLARASEQARAKVRDLATQLAAAENPSKKMARAYEVAAAAADKAAQKMAMQKAALAVAQRSLTGLVRPAESLAAAEARLGQEAERAGQKIIRAAAEESRAARLRRSWLAETTRAANAQAAANRRAAEVEAAANRRLAQSYRERRSAFFNGVTSAGMGIGTTAYMLAPPLQKAMTYDQQLTYMASTMAGGGSVADKRAAYGRISNAIDGALIAGGGKREDAATALNTLIASGKFSDDEALQALGPTVKTAHASGASAEDISKTAVAMRMAGVEIKDMQAGFDMMLRGGQLGMFELRDMARWFPEQLALAKGAGMSGLDAIRQLTAINQVARDTAGTPDKAGNNVVNLLQKLNSKELQTTMAKAVEPEEEDPTKPGKKKGKKPAPPDFDWQGYMIRQQQKGIMPLEAFGQILDRQLAGDERYQAIQKELKSAQTPEDRKALLEAAAKIAEGSKMGEVIADRDALLAALSLFYGKQKRADIDKELGRSGGAVQTESDFVRSQTWSKGQDVQNAADRANEIAYTALKQPLGDLADRVNEAARAFPAFTAGLYAAGTVLAAAGGGFAVGGIVGGLMGGRAADIATKVAPSISEALAPGAVARAAGGGLAGPVGIAGLTATALAAFDPEGNLWGLTARLDRWAQQHLGVDPSNVDVPSKVPALDSEGNLWGLTAGLDRWAERNLGFNPSKIPIPDIDPEGNLWGLTAGLDRWAQQHLGFNPSKIPTDSDAPAGEAPPERADAPPSLPSAPPPAWEGQATPPARPSAPEFAPPPAKPRILLGVRVEDVMRRVEDNLAFHRLTPPPGKWDDLFREGPTGSAGMPPLPLPQLPPAGPAGEKSGEEMGTGIATGLHRQSSLMEDQARQILASVQAILAQGVDLPVRVDTSRVHAALDTVQTRAQRQSDAQVEAMLRATYADTELG